MRERVWALTCLGSVLLAGSLPPSAKADLVVSYRCERDGYNVNYPGETLWNCGGTNTYRVSKAQQEGTWYADWSDADLADLKSRLAGPTPTAGMTWEVRLGIAGNGGTYAVKTTHVETLDSGNDWSEGALDRTAGADACNDFADQDVALPWLNTGSGAATSFWGLTPAFVNSVDMSGWISMVPNWTDDTTYNWVVLDLPLVSHLIDDADCRGLRAHGEWEGGAENAGCANLGQWGGTGGARLLLYEVPEPATMALLGLGSAGLGAIRRRRR